MSRTPAPPNMKEVQALTVLLLQNYSDVIERMRTRWEVKRDNLGRPIGFVPGYDIWLKDSNAFIKELQEHKQVNVIRK